MISIACPTTPIFFFQFFLITIVYLKKIKSMTKSIMQTLLKTNIISPQIFHFREHDFSTKNERPYGW